MIIKKLLFPQKVLINSYLNIITRLIYCQLFLLVLQTANWKSTHFKNIKSLEPGYYIEISNGKLKKKILGF